MGQGFQLQINNGSSRDFTIGQSTTNPSVNFKQQTAPPSPVAPGAVGPPLYFEESGLATLWLQYAAQVGAAPFPEGQIEIRFDSSNTDEFDGSLYIASCTPAPISGTNNFLYPYMVLRLGNASRKWPRGLLTIVEVTAPTLGYAVMN
jgi:hypothetical protein